MKPIFAKRSIALEIMLVFSLILATVGLAGYIVRNFSRALVTEARDAVWESSMPPSYVYSVVSSQWRINQLVNTSLNSKTPVVSITEEISRSEANTDKRWQELLDLSVYFPEKPKNGIKATDEKLRIFRAAYRNTILLAEAGKIAEAKAYSAGEMDLAITSLAKATETLLEAMGERIDFVNERQENTAANGLIALTGLAILAGLLLIFCMAVIYVRIIKPILGLNAVMQALATGDYNVSMPSALRKDEIGRMEDTIRTFRQNLIDTETMRIDQDEQKQRTEQERRELLANLGQKFESSVGRVVQSVASTTKNVEQAAGLMSTDSAAASSQTAAVAAASEQAAGNVRTVAEAAAEISSSMNEVGQQIQRSNEQVRKVVDEAERANADVQALGLAANAISGVTKVISDIAAQTNLLALNATIEAARAGEAGRGFSVVAQEVKQLAAQTGQATSEIAGQIAAIQSTSKAAIDALSSITTRIGEVAKVSVGIGAAVEEQITTTALIATNVEDAASITENVTRNIAKANAAIQNSGTLVIQVLACARDLNRDGAELSREVEQFMEAIRAA